MTSCPQYRGQPHQAFSRGERMPEMWRRLMTCMDFQVLNGAQATLTESGNMNGVRSLHGLQQLSI